MFHLASTAWRAFLLMFSATVVASANRCRSYVLSIFMGSGVGVCLLGAGVGLSSSSQVFCVSDGVADKSAGWAMAAVGVISGAVLIRVRDAGNGDNCKHN